jgi:hypothetical protein
MAGKPLVEGSWIDYHRYPRNVWFGPPQLLTLGMEPAEMEDRAEWIQVLREASTSALHRLVMEHFADGSEQDELEALLAQHGIFAPRFFERTIHERVARRFAKAKIDLEHFTDLAQDHWRELAERRKSRLESRTLALPRPVFRIEIELGEPPRPPTQRRRVNKSDAIQAAVRHLYEQTVVRLMDQPGALRQTEEWFASFSDARTCSLCTRNYRVVDLPHWIYYGSNACTEICFACPVVREPEKEALFSLVPAFVQACGFIPRSSASPIDYGFMSRLSDQRKPAVLLAYAEMGGTEHVKSKFGSWFAALAETGALPEGTQPTPRGVRCLASDGHICYSLDEKRIDDWLSSRGVPHEREPAYPPHPDLNPRGRRRADWRVGDTVIEYFGLIGDAAYEKKMDEKILLAGYWAMNLIAIYPADLDHLEAKLAALAPA